MRAFHLEVWTVGASAPLSVELSAPSASALGDSVREQIRKLFGRAEGYVGLDPETGTFVIGAGFWSRRGRYQLTPVEERE